MFQCYSQELITNYFTLNTTFLSGSDLILIKGTVEITWEIILSPQLLLPIMFVVFGLKSNMYIH